MKEQFINLLNTLYEAEGLVEMTIRRNVNPRDRVTRLALDKCLLLGQLAADIHLPEGTGESAEATPEPLYISEEEKPAPAPGPAPEPEPAQEEMPEEKEVTVFTEEVLPQARHEQPDISDASIFDTTEEEEALPEPEPQPEPGPEHEPEKPAPKAQAKPKPVAAADRKPLMSCFSINDKFRFRRELFGGSDPAFREAIDSLERLKTLSEACSYLFVSHDLDPDDDTVKAFISRIELFFR